MQHSCSLSAAKRLLRPSGGGGVGASARHEAYGLGGMSQRSESQRSDDSGFGNRSVRSSLAGGMASKPLLFPPVAFASAEHAALSKRVGEAAPAAFATAAAAGLVEPSEEASVRGIHCVEFWDVLRVHAAARIRAINVAELAAGHVRC